MIWGVCFPILLLARPVVPHTNGTLIKDALQELEDKSRKRRDAPDADEGDEAGVPTSRYQRQWGGCGRSARRHHLQGGWREP